MIVTSDFLGILKGDFDADRRTHIDRSSILLIATWDSSTVYDTVCSKDSIQ